MNFSYLGRCAVNIVDKVEQVSSERKDVNTECDRFLEMNNFSKLYSPIFCLSSVWYLLLNVRA